MCTSLDQACHLISMSVFVHVCPWHIIFKVKQLLAARLPSWRCFEDVQWERPCAMNSLQAVSNIAKGPCSMVIHSHAVT